MNEDEVGYVLCIFIGLIAIALVAGGIAAAVEAIKLLCERR